MPSCLDSDTLVTLASVADDPEAALRHALECESCRATIAGVVRMRSGFAEAPVRDGFTDDVLSALPTAGTEPAGAVSHRTVGGVGPLWGLVLGGLAAGASVFVAAAADGPDRETLDTPDRNVYLARSLVDMWTTIGSPDPTRTRNTHTVILALSLIALLVITIPSLLVGLGREGGLRFGTD